MSDLFHWFAVKISQLVGSPLAFIAAIFVILFWALSGPTFGFSDTWQLIINTGTTIITFLMVFLIQNTQNRDARATHLKLNELIKSIRGARAGLIDVEDLSDEELEKLHTEFQKIHEKYMKRVEKNKKS